MKSDTLGRELNTQKEIMKKLEETKGEYINTLKKDLSTIEDRYQALLNETHMIGEDFRSQAQENRFLCFELERRIDSVEEEKKALQQSCDEIDL